MAGIRKRIGRKDIIAMVVGAAVTTLYVSFAIAYKEFRSFQYFAAYLGFIATNVVQHMVGNLKAKAYAPPVVSDVVQPLPPMGE